MFVDFPAALQEWHERTLYNAVGMRHSHKLRGGGLHYHLIIDFVLTFEWEGVPLWRVLQCQLGQVNKKEKKGNLCRKERSLPDSTGLTKPLFHIRFQQELCLHKPNVWAQSARGTIC